MSLDRTRRTQLAIVDLGNVTAHRSNIEGYLWLSAYGLPTETGKAPHLFDISVSATLPAQLRMLADAVEAFKE